MLNVIAIMGRLVAAPTMRQTQTGKSVASFRIACNRNRKDANGNDPADFFDVVCWEKTAEFVCKWFQKGSLIAIDGRLQSRNYQDKNGNNRTAIEIVATNVNFAGSKQQNEPDVARPAYSAPAQQDDFAVIDDNEDWPF